MKARLREGAWYMQDFRMSRADGKILDVIFDATRRTEKYWTLTAHGYDVLGTKDGGYGAGCLDVAQGYLTWVDRPDNPALDDARDACASHDCDPVLVVVCGSHAYGTSTDQSDLDVRGAFVPPWRDLVGLGGRDTVEVSPDTVMHSARKLLKLCAAGNPNVLDWLFVPEECVWFMSDDFRRIVHDHRNVFLSRQLLPRFAGYARGHLSKLQRGKTRETGAKRAEDIEEHGMSTKNAMHLIRLARMGCEALETGEYNTRRPDADELLSIRRGEWSLEKVIEEGDGLLARMDAAAERSPLPEKVDREAVSEMLVELTLAVRGVDE